MGRIEELYEKYLKRLVGKLGGNPDAEDIVQETLVARWKQAKDPDDEEAYLTRSVWNNARKRVRRAMAPRRGGGLLTQLENEHDAVDKAPSAEAVLIRREENKRFRARFNAAMAEFSPETQQALVLDSRGLPSKQIAAILGLTDQAVRTRLSRAKATLRERLSQPGDDHDHQG